MKKMLSLVIAALLASYTFTGCVVAPGPPDYYGEEIAPPLPTIVELGDDPYYFHDGYHYRYQNEHWHYARERSGPWRELPRSHWPREVRHSGGEGHGGGPPQEHERR
jgi:hypothetical protein